MSAPNLDVFIGIPKEEIDTPALLMLFAFYYGADTVDSQVEKKNTDRSPTAEVY